MNLTLYIATAFEGNASQLQNAIRKAAPAVQILDWSIQNSSFESQYGRNRHPENRFDFCADACMSADLVICPAQDRELCVQAGMAYAAGVPVLGIRGQPFPLLLAGCFSLVVETESEILQVVTRLQDCMSRIETDCKADMSACVMCTSRSVCRYFLVQEAI